MTDDHITWGGIAPKVVSINHLEFSNDLLNTLGYVQTNQSISNQHLNVFSNNPSECVYFKDQKVLPK